MTQKISRKEALELAQKIMTDAEAERAACAEAEARRTTDVVGHWPVVTGSDIRHLKAASEEANRNPNDDGFRIHLQSNAQAEPRGN